MRRAMVLGFLVALATSAGAATVEATDVWRPLFTYLGRWKGAHVEAGRTVKTTRIYAPLFDTKQVEIRDSGGGQPGQAVRGVIRYDAPRQVLVLHDPAQEGAAADLTLAPPARPGAPLVFSGGGTRITYERTGERSFVERVERAGGDGTLGLVSETRFVRAE